MPQVECNTSKPLADDAGSYVLAVDLDSCPHRHLKSRNAQHIGLCTACMQALCCGMLLIKKNVMHTVMYIYHLCCIVYPIAVISDYNVHMLYQPRVQANTSITRQCMQRTNSKQSQVPKLCLESFISVSFYNL